MAFSDADGELEELVFVGAADVVEVVPELAVDSVPAVEPLEELPDEPQPATSITAQQAITAALALLIGGDPFSTCWRHGQSHTAAAVVTGRP